MLDQSRVAQPLSPDEHSAMVRFLFGIRKQLQQVSDLFSTRYGRDSSIAESAVKTLVSMTLFEHELGLLESPHAAPGAPERGDVESEEEHNQPQPRGIGHSAL